MITQLSQRRSTLLRTFSSSLVVAVLIVTVVPVGVAQDISVGGRIEPGAGWISGSDWEDAVDFFDDNRAGEPSKPALTFAGGLAAAFGFAPGFAVQVEVAVSNLGGNYGYTAFGIDVDGKQRATLLQVPVLLKPRIQTAGGDFFFLLGPTVGIFLTDVATEESGGGITVEGDSEPDNQIIAGIVLAVGHEWEVGTGYLGVDLRYTRQLTDTFEDFNSRQNVVGLGISYLQRVR